MSNRLGTATRASTAALAPTRLRRPHALHRATLLACWVAALLAYGAPPAAAQEPESRVLATALGGLAGLGAGSYIGLSIIVAESRAGRYIHDANDVLGWRSLPVLIGIGTGAALGAYSPRRLEGSVLFGFAGLGAGALLGLGLGALIWEPPEGRWAGAAIGAGVGLLIGGVFGMLEPPRAGDDDPAAAPAASVTMLRIRF